MIYNYGTIWFYETKSNRQYDNSGNKNMLHHFITNTIPAFQIVEGIVGTANYTLYDINENVIQTGACSATSFQTDQSVDYTVIKLTGAVASGQSDGKYYLKVSYGASEIFSDVFCWQTDLSDYLKISADTSAPKIGKFPLTDFVYVAYFKSVMFLEEFETQEEANEKTYGVVPIYTSRNRMHTHQVAGYNKTLNFLSGLRVLESNGTITITWQGEELEVYDIQAEPGNVVNNNQYITDLKFKIQDYLQTYNNV